MGRECWRIFNWPLLSSYWRLTNDMRKKNKNENIIRQVLGFTSLFFHDPYNVTSVFRTVNIILQSRLRTSAMSRGAYFFRNKNVIYFVLRRTKKKTENSRPTMRPLPPPPPPPPPLLSSPCHRTLNILHRYIYIYALSSYTFGVYQLNIIIIININVVITIIIYGPCARFTNLSRPHTLQAIIKVLFYIIIIRSPRWRFKPAAWSYTALLAWRTTR